MFWSWLLVALSGVACVALIIFALMSLVGYQDEEGFHYGTKIDWWWPRHGSHEIDDKAAETQQEKARATELEDHNRS